VKQIFLISLFFLSGIAYGQADENIHIHFDKDIYLPGETIWFKAYLYSNNTPSALSTNFYVAMYDAEGKLMEQKQYPIIDGSCNGDFKLADTIETNSIRVRALTKAILLYDSTYFFEKLLTVYTKENRVTDQLNYKENLINLQFFAEGGSFIAGINNYLAFKAAYTDGTPAQISGIIIDELSNTIIDSFKTDNLGLGRFQFAPVEHYKYIAKWNSDNGKSYTTALPNVLKSGVVLHTELLQNTVHYLINKNDESGNLNTMHLLAQIGDEEMYKADLFFGDKNQVVNKFSVDSMPTGILQITLFDNNWLQVAQSILFINPVEPSSTGIEITEINIHNKAKNVIEIDLHNSGLTNLSASIADMNFYIKPNNYTIKQNLLFKQLKGLTKMLNDELDKNNTQAINLIMLTHDWKKLSWQSIVNNQSIIYKNVDNYLSLTVDYNKKNRLPQTEILNFIINDKVSGKKFLTVQPNTANNFKQTGLIFYDSAKIYFGLKNEKEESQYLTASIDGLVNFPKTIEPQKLVKLQSSLYIAKANNFIDSIVNNKPKKFNEEQTIKEVVVKTRYKNPETKRILELEEKYTSGMFSGIARGYQLNLLDDKNAWSHSDVLNYIVYRVPPLKICTIRGERFLLSSRSNSACKIENAVITFVDEVELPNQIGLSSIPITQLAYIKFIPGIVIGSSFVSNNGALYIYTKKGDEVESVSQTMKSIYIKGYDVPKYFSNPDYSEKTSLLNSDLRTTLYWNPYLVADENSRKIKIEYYNNDVSKKLLLTIEGFDENGKLIHIEKIIENQ